MIPVRLAVQRTYRGEKDVGELTGKNDGKRIDEYLKAANLKPGLPCCSRRYMGIQTARNKSSVSGWSRMVSIALQYATRRIYKGFEPFGCISVKPRKKNRTRWFIDEKWENGTAYINTFDLIQWQGSNDGEATII